MLWFSVIFSLPRLYSYASKIADKIIKINPKIIVTVDTKDLILSNKIIKIN